LSNNCSTKQAYFSIQAICFKKYVESLNSCQTIIRQKRLFFTIVLYRHWADKFLKKLIAVSARIKNFVWNLTGNKTLQKCIQIADIFHCFCNINAYYQYVKKKSRKAWKFPDNCLYNRQTFYRNIPPPMSGGFFSQTFICVVWTIVSDYWIEFKFR
jgi:hypothetical protein